MNILHLLPWATTNGESGGPVTVAADLAAAQRKAGHEASLVAGGATTAQLELRDGVSLRTFKYVKVPGLGHAGLFSALLLNHLRRNTRADIVHVHMARDLTTPIAARDLGRARRPFVVQTHGMIDASSRRLAHLADEILIRPALREAAHVFALTRDEASELRRLGVEQERLSVLRNSVTMPAAPEVDRRTHGSPMVLFLSRLHPRKHLLDFIEAARIVRQRRPSAVFEFAGPDEGDLAAALERSGDDPDIRYLGPLNRDQVVEAMRRAHVYVLPAPKEPFGLTIVEALSQGTPAIIHETAELAPTLTQHLSGWTFRGGPSELAEAICAALDDPHPGATRERAIRTALDEYAVGPVVEAVESRYEAAIEGLHQQGDRP